ncbi:MAG: M14 family zinc carboxypeptidase [Gemmatimonadaceae bacterium]
MPVYLNTAGVNAKIDQLSAPPQDICTAELLPEKSRETREVRCLRLSKNFAASKPAVLINAGMHGDERAQPDGALAFVDALLAAYVAGVPFTAGGYVLGTDRVKAILENLVVYVVPLANPDGRERNTRKNAAPGGGVDLNRNFDILWDYPKYFKLPDADVHSEKTVKAHPNFIGDSKESEPETRNVKWVLEQKGIIYYFDLHSAVPAIYYPWGLDTNQGIDSTKNFSNRAWDLKRDGVHGAAYEEFIPPPVLLDHRNIAEAMRAAIALSTGSAYDVDQSANFYVTSGASDDYAFSIAMERRAFTVEFGSVKEPDPVAADGLTKVIIEIQAALAAALSAIAAVVPVAPPAPPATPLPIPTPAGRLWNAIKVILGWLLAFLLRVFVLRRNPPTYRSPIPTPAPPPRSASVHSLRLGVATATAGQAVRGTLLDNSLDFTTIAPGSFGIFLQVPPRAGAIGNIFFRVLQFRLLGPRELEFVVPPVGNANPALMVPPGSYIVLCRYSFWSVEADRLLTVR